MRSSTERRKKYRAKVDGTISKIRVDRYGAEQKARFSSAVMEQTKIEQEVKRMAIDYNASTMLMHFYTNFGKKCYQLKKKFGGDNLCTELDAATNAWYARGLDRNLLCTIREYYVPACPCAPLIPCDTFLTKEECEAAGCCWTGLHCITAPCSCEDYETQEECEANGCYWYDEACHSEPIPCDWSYKMKLTFTGNVSATNLDDFPVLVVLDSGNFNFAHAKTNGEDIRFMDSDTCPSDGTPLKHEIEFWDAVAQKACVWVKVPRIDGGSVTDFIYMFFGNPAAADGQDVVNVWNNNYKMVQHMDDLTTATIEDSTQYNNDGNKKAANQPVECVGQICKAQDFEKSNTEYITVLDSASLDSPSTGVTIELWLWMESAPVATDYYTPLRKSDHYAVMITDARRIYFDLHGITGWMGHLDSAPLNIQTWYHVVCTWNGTTAYIYINGGAPVTKNWSDTLTPSAYNLEIGRMVQNATIKYWMDGILDEVRVLNWHYIENWAVAQYKSQNNTLITYGAEEPA